MSHSNPSRMKQLLKLVTGLRVFLYRIKVFNQLGEYLIFQFLRTPNNLLLVTDLFTPVLSIAYLKVRISIQRHLLILQFQVSLARGSVMPVLQTIFNG